MTRRLTFATALLVALGALGCSGTRPDAEMTEVTGRVTVGGRPPERLIMNLTPATPGTGREDECVVERGAYRVKLIRARYKVSFTPCPGSPPVPARYLTPAASELVLDGTRSEPADFDLN
jgi:hypothetical protein